MQMAGGYTPSANPNKRLYNGGSEWQDDIDGLADYYSTFFREYDAVIGRFNGVDPMAEGTDELSTYAYSGNNPIMMNDPLGDNPKDPNKKSLAEEMMEDYKKWHDSRYRSAWDWDPFGGGSNGGDEMGLYTSSELLRALKAHLNAEGIPRIGYFKSQLGFWENFVGDSYEGDDDQMRGVTIGTRFISLVRQSDFGSTLKRGAMNTFDYKVNSFSIIPTLMPFGRQVGERWGFGKPQITGRLLAGSGMAFRAFSKLLTVEAGYRTVTVFGIKDNQLEIGGHIIESGKFGDKIMRTEIALALYGGTGYEKTEIVQPDGTRIIIETYSAGAFILNTENNTNLNTGENSKTLNINPSIRYGIGLMWELGIKIPIYRTQ